MDETPRGIKTTEFWLSAIAMLVALLLSSGLFSEGSIWVQALGVIATALASLGYSYTRGRTKAAQLFASAERD